jgi:hypothetical protein
MTAFSSLAGPPWDCTRCAQRNSAHATECGRCGDPHPSVAIAVNGPPRPEAVWTFLFVDDAGTAHATFCSHREDVRRAVADWMTMDPDAEVLNDAREDMTGPIADHLIATGRYDTEGDGSCYLASTKTGMSGPLREPAPATPAARMVTGGDDELAAFKSLFHGARDADMDYDAALRCGLDAAWRARAMRTPASAEALGVDVLRIPAQPGLDPITVYFDDAGNGRGRMTIACYGEAWATAVTAGWGAMGPRSVRQFVSGVDASYLSGALCSLAPGMTTRNREYVHRIAKAVIAALNSTEARTDG